MSRFDRIFQREDLSGDGACPTYMTRWTLFRRGDICVYLHHFLHDDWSRDLHDHPKRFISIGLKGDYVEEVRDGDWPWHRSRWYSAPWIRTFPALYSHRIRLHPGHTCWTLCITLWKEREWGWWHEGRWVHWRTYVGDRGMVDKVKVCK